MTTLRKTINDMVSSIVYRSDGTMTKEQARDLIVEALDFPVVAAPLNDVIEGLIAERREVQ